MGEELDASLLMPPPFARGLDRWSPADGDPAGPSLADGPGAFFLRRDEALGHCVELRLRRRVTSVRWMGETPLLAGRVLRLSVRARGQTGHAAVRLAGWAGGAGGRELTGQPASGREVPLDARRVRTAVATVARSAPAPGLDMAWDQCAIFGHFGFDVLGEEGAIVRLDRLRVELLPRTEFRA